MIDFLVTEPLVKQVGIAVGIIIVFTLIRNIIVKTLLNYIFKLSKRTQTSQDANILVVFEKPIKSFLVILGFYIASLYLPLGAAVDLFLLQAFRSLIIIFISWGFYNLISSSVLLQEISNKFNIQIDPILIPFLSKLLQFIIIALALSVIAQEWGYDVNGFIAGLGLGGLAIALAAQDTVKNIFGGIVIITEKPFSIGDWIETPNVEGTVEDMSFRSTRVRTFANALVTVPNSVLANQAITNWTRMGKRRVSFHLGVTYTTPREKLKQCVARIQELLEAHDDVHKDLIFVKFDTFGASSLDIFVYFFTITTQWGEFLKVKENINFHIMKILEEEGVSVAFPSRSLYFENNLSLSQPNESKSANNNMPDEKEF